MSKKKLEQELGELITQARSLHEKAEKESRGFTDEESGQWDNLNNKIDEVKGRIEKSKRAHELDLLDGKSQGLIFPRGDSQDYRANNDADIESRAFNAWLKRKAHENVPQEYLEITQRAFSAGTNNTGGYTVPQAFYNNLEIALKAYGDLMKVVGVIPTETGALMPMPTLNYTGVAASILGENTAATADSSTPFGVVNLNAYTYVSPILPVSYQFMQDSAFGEKYLADVLGLTIARGFNAHATTGTGTGQPQGLVTAAVSGKVGTTGQTLTVIFDDVVDLIHSIDPAYRPTSKFMLHDSSLKVLRKLKDSSGRPIFLPGFDGMGKPMPDTVLGYEAVINQDMPVMAANAKSILFGEFSKYKVRMVKDVQVNRLVERYAELLQIGFICYARLDGRLLDAGTNPIKYYANSAT